MYKKYLKTINIFSLKDVQRDKYITYCYFLWKNKFSFLSLSQIQNAMIKKSGEKSMMQLSQICQIMRHYTLIIEKESLIKFRFII